MAFYRCGGGGIPSSLKTDMNAVLNKKFGTSADYPPADWPDTVNLMGPLPEKTIVSSPIADFSDGADDVPTKSLVVTIPPTLSGVSAITETQTGRNLLNYADITNSYRITSITENSSGSFTVVASGLGAYIDHVIKVKAGQTYSIKCTSATNDEGNASQIGVVNVYDGSDDTATLLLNGASISTRKGFTPTGDYILVRNKVTGGSGAGTGTIVEPQLELGSTVHAYEPYTTPTQYTANLGRTIYGGQVDIVNGEGTEQYKKVKVSDLTWAKQTVSGRDFFIANISKQEITNTHDVAIDITGLTYAGMVTVSSMSDKSLAKWLQSVRIYDTSILSVSDLLSAYGNGEIVFYLKDAEQTDFTFEPAEVNTRLGYNAFWSGEGDTEVTYRADINLALGGQ